MVARCELANVIEGRSPSFVREWLACMNTIVTTILIMRRIEYKEERSAYAVPACYTSSQRDVVHVCVPRAHAVRDAVSP